MAEDYQEYVKPWGLFMDELAKDIREEEFPSIKTIIRDKLSAREWEGIKEPFQLLEALENKGLISEDNTGLLGDLLDKGEFHDLKRILEDYKEKRKLYVENVSILAGKRDPLFVGRDGYIRTILDFFRDTRYLRVRCVCLWGMAGSGKTKLAAETCAIYAEMSAPSPTLILIDLNKKNTLEEVGLALLSSVGHPVELDKFAFSMVFRWIEECHTEHVLLFDNADDLLKPTSVTKDHFQNMLKEFLKFRNQMVKILITSRYAVDFLHLSSEYNFIAREVKSLEMDEAVLLLTKSIKNRHHSRPQVKGQEELISEEQARQLAEHCGKNPQALRAVASQLRSGKSPETLIRLLSNPAKMELVLNDQSLWGLGEDATRESALQSTQVLKCLEVMFEDMNPHLQPILVRLAVLPGLFSKEWGITILTDADTDAEEIEFFLDDVANTSLLLRETLDIFQTETGRNLRDKYYSMHPLVRCLCLMNVSTNDIMKKAFQGGVLAFVKRCFILLKEFTKVDNEDASGSLQRIEHEKININQYLELEMRKTFDGKPHPLARYLPDYPTMQEHSRISRESNILAFMERFMLTKRRSTFFQQRSEVARAGNDMPGWVNYQGWFADQQLQLHKFNEAEAAIKEPLALCKERMPLREPGLIEGYCQCRYVEGNLLASKPQKRPHMIVEKRREGIAIMIECIKQREIHLQDSIVTARSINALGSIYFSDRKYEESLEHHKRALEMLKRVTGGRPESHPDSTIYVMNIGTCYHELGYKYSKSLTQKDKGQRYFENAISNYNLGREMLRCVGLEKSSIMGSMLKNLAMTYCEMKDYKTALDYADEAASIRIKTLGKDHPDVARAHYFVGSLYKSLGDEAKSRGERVGSIEEYKKARECFDMALDIEFKVGYDRRSIDYDDLKEDMEELFKLLGKKEEWQRYQQRIKVHEGKAAAPISSEATASTSSGSDSPRKRAHDPLDLSSITDPESPPDPKKCPLS